MGTMLKQAKGFTLLEVMIALLIIALGLLGVAALQAAVVNNTSQSRLRGLAALQAGSLASAMHANTAYWQSISSTTTTAPTAGSCASSTCTAAQMAGYDVQQWQSTLQASLPSGTGTFSCSPPSSTGPAVCTITVSWLEKNVTTNKNTAASSYSTVTYQSVVTP